MTNDTTKLLQASGPDIDWPSLSICVTGAGLAGVSATFSRNGAVAHDGSGVSLRLGLEAIGDVPAHGHRAQDVSG